MIQATIVTQQNEIVAIELSGHADSGEYGQDIVCSAVSALVIATLNSIETLLEVDPIIEKASEEEGGYLYATFKQSDSSDEKVQLLLNHLKLGLESIAENYQAYIEVKETN